MARFSRLEVLNETINIGVVPVFYHGDLEVAKQVVAACAAGGARVIEFTNRGDNAYRIFSDLVQYFATTDPKIILGVGSVIDPATAALYLSSGANFVVGPILNPEVAKVCNRRKVSYSPGCGSASEISEAEELGVEIVKVFPGDSVGGPNFVKAVLGPTPWTRIMPTGGVEATKESITAWFKAGVAAVGIGSHLVKKEWIDAGNYDAMTALTGQIIGWIRELRGKGLFLGVEHPGLYPYGTATAKDIAEWYGEKFGFKVNEGNSSFFLVGPGYGRIEVMKKPDTDRCHLAILVSDFDAAVAAAKTKGLELDEATLVNRPDTKAVYFKQRDPGGNIVHLLWRK
jgi:2-dehydro-3-deoxyphosphogluconate aldolase / (4S)-4-hydroxy-2-oxoglutarate aldolase